MKPHAPICTLLRWAASPRPVLLRPCTIRERPTSDTQTWASAAWAPIAEDTKPAPGGDRSQWLAWPSEAVQWPSSPLGLGQHPAVSEPPAAVLEEPGTGVCPAQTEDRQGHLPRGSSPRDTPDDRGRGLLSSGLPHG